MKVIIGGGISGLIAAFYNEDYFLISKDIGGQMVNNFLGPRILEIDEYSEMFLDDLGIEKVEKVAKIGFMDSEEVKTESDSDFRLKYYLKSRCLDKALNIPDSIMSQGKNYINYYDVDWNYVVDKIKSKIKDKIINSNVSYIDVESNTLLLDDGRIIEYEDIISTIPAPIFYKLINETAGVEFKFIPKLFIVVDKINIDMKNFDYVYCLGNNKFHRITKINDNKYAIEYTTKERYENIIKNWYPSPKTYCQVLYGQIVSGKVDSFDNISFVGRFAEWKHGIKINNVIERFVRGKVNA